MVNYVESTDLGERDVTAVLEGMDFDRFMVADRWNLHRNEPWWVVGEQRQWPLGDFVSPLAVPLGDVTTLMLPWEAIFYSKMRKWRNPKWVPKKYDGKQDIISSISYIQRELARSEEVNQTNKWCPVDTNCLAVVLLKSTASTPQAVGSTLDDS